MKQIQNYHADKYDNGAYEYIEEGIYFLASEGIYVTSLSFVPEEEFEEFDEYGELAQYPLEDVLEEFCCYISDSYEDEVSLEPGAECREFASNDLEDIRRLRTMIGKHVYNQQAGECVKLVIEDERTVPLEPKSEIQDEPQSKLQAESKAEPHLESQAEHNVEPQPPAERKAKGLLGFLRSLIKRK